MDVFEVNNKKGSPNMVCFLGQLNEDKEYKEVEIKSRSLGKKF